MEVIAITHDSADLQWKAPDHDGGTPITKYIIAIRSATRLSWTQVGEVDANVHVFKVLGLNEGTEYYFHVIAVNEEGESPPLETTDVTIPKREIRKFEVINYLTKNAKTVESLFFARKEFFKIIFLDIFYKHFSTLSNFLDCQVHSL